MNNNMTPKTPSQLAEALAKRCALYLSGHSIEQYHRLTHIQAQVDSQQYDILQSIPLVELLTCANELKNLAQDLAINTAALTALNAKLTTLLGENE